jgi:phosphohistidine phosphatase
MGIQLYLVQHGEAVPDTENPERPLTARGREDIRRLAAFLAEAKVCPARVVHSGKLRAADSASLLAAAIGNDVSIEIQEKGLLPGDTPVPLAEAVGEWQDDTLVVGHQPFMSRLVSRLLLGREQPTIVEFTPATIACLARRPVTGAWYLAWVLVPELLRR